MKTYDRIGYYRNNTSSTIRKSFVLIIALLLFTTVFMNGFALSENTPKEEVIYVNLNLDGSVNSIYVVNIFDLSEDGKIIDYGDYTAFRQLTSSGKIRMENETITINAKAGKLYYEGTLEKHSIPWLFNIRYYINGEEVTGTETAGMNGALEIQMDIRENKNADSRFFDHMTLQVSFALDTEICKNIKGNGATIVNAGKNKQVLFTLLPKREMDLSITTDVVNFEMNGISINAIPMNMDFSFEDDEDMMSKLREFKDGIAEMDDGAKELRDGAKKLEEGTKDLKEGTLDIKDGVIELADGTDKLTDGVTELDDGIRELDEGVIDLSEGTGELADGARDLNNGTKKLYSGAKKLYNGADAISDGLARLSSQNKAIMGGAGQIFDSMLDTASSNLGVHLTRGNFKAILNDMLDQIGGTALQEALARAESEIIDAVTLQVLEDIKHSMPEADEEEILNIMNSDSVKAQIAALVALEMAERSDQIIQSVQGELAANPDYFALYTIREQLSGFADFYNGLDSYTSGVSDLAGGASKLLTGMDEWLSGMADLREGTIELKDGAAELHEGVLELKDGTVKLLEGSMELKDGTIELNDGMIELKDGVIKLFDGAIELYDGTVELYDGTVTMAEGTFEFRDKTANMEKDIKDMIRDKIDEMLGKNFIPISFVSDKNKNVESIQFAMQTEPILLPETPEPPETENKLSFIDRLRNLFRR